MIKEECTKSSSKMPHCLNLDNRKKLSISGVSEVDSYDDKSVILYTDMGELTVKGENLNIKKLNLELGELEITGRISALNYVDKNLDSCGGFFSKIFK